eukprot:gene3909-2590_t
MSPRCAAPPYADEREAVMERLAEALHETKRALRASDSVLFKPHRRASEGRPHAEPHPAPGVARPALLQGAAGGGLRNLLDHHR